MSRRNDPNHRYLDGMAESIAADLRKKHGEPYGIRVTDKDGVGDRIVPFINGSAKLDPGCRFYRLVWNEPNKAQCEAPK